MELENKTKNSNWRRAYAGCFAAVTEGLSMFRLGAAVTGGNEPGRQFVLYEKNFNWMDVW
jgi:hypothetical protein